MTSELSDITSSRDRAIPELVTDSPVEPVSLSEFKLFAKIPAANTGQDSVLSSLITTSRKALETLTGKVCIQQVWKETRDYVSGDLRLYRTPLISVSSITYIPNWSTDTPETFSSSSYVSSVAKGRVVPRATSWPTHRGWQSFFITYKAGWGDIPPLSVPPVEGEEALLQAAAIAKVPKDFKTAIMEYALWLYENPEGYIDFKYAAIIEKFGAVPPMVRQLLTPYIRWAL